MRLIDADALLEKFNRKADIWTALTDEDTAGDFAFYCKLADAVEEMPTIGGWISVNDKLPDDTAKGRLYLVVNNGNVDVGIFHYGLWLLPTNNVNVSHWMPFPEAPKEGE